MSSTPTLAKSTIKPQQRPEVMERLFARLLAFYGVKFTEAFAGVKVEVMREVWSEELAGYTLDELNRGVNGCRSSKWPPTLPEFMGMCRPPVNHEAAYHEAIENMRLRESGINCEWSHPAIYHAAVKVTPFDLRRLPYPALKARWSSILERLLNDANLPPVPPVALALDRPATRGPTPKEREALESLKQGKKNATATV